MPTYRVVLHIDVNDAQVAEQLGQEYLEEIQQTADSDDYLALYIEHELGWAEQSFRRVSVEEIKALHPRPKRAQAKSKLRRSKKQGAKTALNITSERAQVTFTS